MKDMEQIEELLNSYIDGELDERKTNEVKRLIDNDEQVRQAFDSLSRYKKLMASVSPAAAPAGFCESVTKQLEREVLLADTSVYHHHAGSRHLVIRRLITAAAIIALMAVLSVIVFDVFVPKSDRDKFVSNALNRKQKPQVLYEKPFADAKNPSEDAVIAVQPQKTSPIPMVAKLTLVTDSPVETDWLVGKALMNTGLFDKTVEVDRKTGSVKYVLNCDRDSLVSLIGELSFIWPNCTDAELQIGTEQAGKYVTVNNVTAQQVLEICKADNFDRRMRMANDIAIINNAAATDVLKNYFAKQDSGSEFFMPDKPVLTSPEKAQQSKFNSTGPKANLTILVIEK